MERKPTIPSYRLALRPPSKQLYDQLRKWEILFPAHPMHSPELEKIDLQHPQGQADHPLLFPMSKQHFQLQLHWLHLLPIIQKSLIIWVGSLSTKSNSSIMQYCLLEQQHTSVISQVGRMYADCRAYPYLLWGREHVSDKPLARKKRELKHGSMKQWQKNNTVYSKFKLKIRYHATNHN